MKNMRLSVICFRLFLVSAVFLTLMPCPMTLYAGSLTMEEQADFIVKYRDDEGSLMSGNSLPFDVVKKEDLNRLIREDALEWFEEDGEAILLDVDPENLSADSSEYYSSEQWHLSVINADPAFINGFLGQGVRVGVLDSGVSPHTAFGSRLVEGHNYIENAKDPKETIDDYGHGTKVAGLVAGADASGYTGAAPEALIVPLKCTNGRTVKISTICKAIYGGIDDYDCDVLNLSLGVQTEYQALKEAVEYAEEKNVVIVSAVGNGGSSTVYYPAKYDTVIGVGALDRDENLYYRSNYNSSVFLTAPGVEVKTTESHGGYDTGTGCSFAVPQVSGAVAVLLGIDDTLAPDRVMEILSETAKDRGAVGYDEYYGHGILNIGGCVEALTDSENEQESSSGNDKEPDDSYEPLKPDDPSVSPGETDSPDTQDSSDTDEQTEPMYPPVDPEPVPSEQAKPSDQYIFPDSSEKDNPSDSSEIPVNPDETNPPEKTVMPDVSGYSQCLQNEKCLLNAFVDLDRNAWYHDGIHYMLEKGIMKGTGEHTFEPVANTSRAMIVTMLWRMNDSPVADRSLSFTDVKDGQWYTEAVRWAVSEKLITGYSDTLFGPDDNVSREQLAVILWRYAFYQGKGNSMIVKDILGGFSDTEQISFWALDAMRWAVGSGLIEGVGNENLSPEVDASRAQVATMLLRYQNMIFSENDA